MDSSQTGIEDEAALTGEVVDVDAEAPRYGTLAWLELHEHVDVMGRELPGVHRIPAGSVFRSDEERGYRCAVVKPGGVACGAPGTKRYGVCLVHAGGGADPAAISPKGVAKLGRLRIQRELLGIGPARMANPRMVARLAAQARGEDIAAALLGPLDARGLSAMDRQAAARVILGETFPIQTVTVDVEVPADAAGVAELGWGELQALAARLLEA